jgi:hypothetical protein
VKWERRRIAENGHSFSGRYIRPPTGAAQFFKGDLQGDLGAPEVQKMDLLGPLRRPDLPDLPDLVDPRCLDRLYRPLPQRGPEAPEALEALEALEVPQAPETNRNHLIRASSPKPRPTIFFA